MAIRPKRFGAIRQASTWQRMQNWRQNQKALREKYEINTSDTAMRLTTAWTNHISGSAGLATQAAVNRMREATEAKFDSVDKLV